MGKEIVNITESKVRFSEVDSMRVVWHGNYAKFLEDGREAFGIQYKLGYYDVFDHGFMTPIVDLQMSYKQSIRYGDLVSIETVYKPSNAAKIEFDYCIRRASDKQVALTGSSTQVFIDKSGELQLTKPDFYVAWQKELGVL